MDFFKKIPVIGKIVEIVDGDDYVTRLKNLCRRSFVSGTAAVAAISVPMAAVVGSGGLAIAGDSWAEIDESIEKLSESDAKSIYYIIAGWNLM